mgnify:FL=1
MTVLNYLRLKDGGVAVADEQGSTAERHTNSFDKLLTIGLGGERKAIYGGTGPVNELFTTLYHDSQREFEQKGISESLNQLRSAADAVRDVITRYMVGEKDAILRNRMGFGLEDLSAGTLQSGRSLSADSINTSKQILGGLEGSKGLGILLGGIENDRFEIYGITNGGNRTQFYAPNATLGSGYDKSNEVLSGFVSGMTREERRTIPDDEGIVAAIEATNGSSDINNGVGGTPSIIYMANDGTIAIPREAQCHQAQEVVRGLTQGFLEIDFVRGAVYDLVVKDKAPGTIEEEMMKEATDA